MYTSESTHTHYHIHHQMVVLAKRSLGEILSAMELMDAQSLDVVLRKPAWGLRNPLGGRCVRISGLYVFG